MNRRAEDDGQLTGGLTHGSDCCSVLSCSVCGAVGNMRVVSGGALDVDLKVRHAARSRALPGVRGQRIADSLHCCVALLSVRAVLGWQILDPRGKVVFEQSRRTEETFQFYAQDSGLHQFCFSNAMSVVSGKAVSFSIFVGARLHQKDAAKPQHLSGLESGITKLAQSQTQHNDSEAGRCGERVCEWRADPGCCALCAGIREVRDWNSHMKSRERVHHATVESTATRVWAWRIVQIGVTSTQRSASQAQDRGRRSGRLFLTPLPCVVVQALVAVAFFKVFYLRGMFETKRGA